MSCCQRFAPYHADPAAFFEARDAIDLDRLSLSPDGERRVTVTARGLFLTRAIAVQHDREAIYDVVHRVHAPPRWDHDTYLGGLALTAAQVEQYRRGRVLDVASGLALFATEMSALGAEVDCVDLELDDAHPSFAAAKEHVRARYATQLSFLACLAAHGPGERYRLDAATARLLDELSAAAALVVERYPAISGRRLRLDARDLAALDADRYDAVLSGWLMVHLEPDDERRVLESMARVVRPGGRLHVRAGYGADLAPRLRAWFPGLAIAGKRFELEATSEDLAVLRASTL
jgi:2-polyprenyl-3-methyl-5-hydroxy-6-metoxy-1,4-benzoquinol methylase